MDGSLMTMPRSLTHTSVLAVPRSMPMSFEKRPKKESFQRRRVSMGPFILFLELLHNFRIRHESGRAARALDLFDATLRHRFLGHDEAHRNADQVGIGELLAGARIAV